MLQDILWAGSNTACMHACVQGDDGAGEQEEEDETARLFRLAAEQLKEKREEDAMSVEERILKWRPFPCSCTQC